MKRIYVIMDRRQIGFYNYTVVLTYLGFLIALCGMKQAMSGQFLNAIICLMLTGICDMFDGAVAATKKDRTHQEKRFGIQIDSLSDLVSFGIFPAILVYEMSERTSAIGVICLVYSLCALIRLAYYNVLEEERQDRITEQLKTDVSLEKQVMEEEKKVYLGLPVTFIAITLPAVFFFYGDNLIQAKLWLGGLMAVMAVAFVTPFRIQKPRVMGKVVLLILGMLEIVAMTWLAFVGAT